MTPEERAKLKKRSKPAFTAMERLGIARDRVKPVLKRLLLESDWQWDYIESDSYLALADAIFEAQDNPQEGEGCSTRTGDLTPVINGHREKRLKCEESPSTSNGPNCQAQNRTPSTSKGPNCQAQNRTPSTGNGPNCQASPAQKRPCPQQNKSSPVNKPVLSLPPCSGRPPVQHKPRNGENMNEIVLYKPDANSNHGNSSRRDDKRKEPEIEIKPISVSYPNNQGNYSRRDEKRKIPEIEVEPLNVAYPNNNSNSSRRRLDKGKAKITELSEQSSTNLQIASCETNEINISFNCPETMLNDPNFNPPTVEELCKHVETRCMDSYRILNPNFSLLNIFTEMCKTFKEIGYTPLEKRRDHLVKIVPAPGAEHLFSGIVGYSTSNPTFNNMSIIPFNIPIPPHDHEDISRGLENVKISILRDPNSNEEYPPIFQYISKNLSYQNAYVSISLARIGDESCCSECRGDCILSPFPCACAGETGGCFAYTMNGLLREEFLAACMEKWREPKKEDFVYCKENCPLERVINKKRPECKGHLVKKFIKECWAKCGCKLQCGNRVVQRGITANLQVFKSSEEKGWGLRSLDGLPKGSFVCEYVGVVLTNIELYERQRRTGGNTRHTYPVLLDADWGTEGILKDEEALCLDATHYGNIARFINHRCHDGNLISIPVEIETPDHHYYHLAFFTNRDVSSLEELTWDYGIDFNDEDHPIKAFRCKCGSQYCRDLKNLARATKTKQQQSKYILG